jgi:hypothetical protein
MTLMETAQVLGNFGEFFGAIVVFMTLAYLTIQVRQNTRSINAANYFNAALTYNQINSLSISDGTLNEIWIKSNQEEESLSDAERGRLFMMLRSYNNNFMAIWWSHQEGTFPEEQFRVYERNFIQLVASPVGPMLIDSLQYDYPDYATYLTEKVLERGATVFDPKSGYSTEEERRMRGD